MSPQNPGSYMLFSLGHTLKTFALTFTGVCVCVTQSERARGLPSLSPCRRRCGRNTSNSRMCNDVCSTLCSLMHFFHFDKQRRRRIAAATRPNSHALCVAQVQRICARMQHIQECILNIRLARFFSRMVCCICTLQKRRKKPQTFYAAVVVKQSE